MTNQNVKFKKLLIDNMVSRQEIADATEIAKQTVDAYIDGRIKPSGKVMKKFGKYFAKRGVTVDIFKIFYH